MIYELSEKQNVPLFVGFNKRFDPTYQAVYKSVYEGQVGHIWQIRHSSRDHPSPSLDYLKTAGNIFIDCMIHQIDLQFHFLGELPIEVFTVTQNNIPELKALGQYDGALCTFKYPSGKIVVPGH